MKMEKFIEACKYGDLKIIEKLLQEGVDCTAQDNYAIAIASLYGNYKVIQLLLKNGADCTANDNLAIRWASGNDNKKIVELLLDHGADCTAMNNEAIRVASKDRHKEVVELLLEYGADPKACDERYNEFNVFDHLKPIDRLISIPFDFYVIQKERGRYVSAFLVLSLTWVVIALLVTFFISHPIHLIIIGLIYFLIGRIKSMIKMI